MLKIGIARGIPEHNLLPAFQAALEGGFYYLEITMNTPDAVKLISIAAREFNGKAQIGAGTVTSLNEAKRLSKPGTVYHFFL